ncbi:MAG: hypothetical protein HYT79_02690 [Elusimicrobia bacterium]|nr:hypothetical protein [Elusimicrobiota bacterium]
MNTSSASGSCMEEVKDYNALEALEKTEGREVLVLYSRLVHRVIQGKWEAVGRVDEKGNVTYRRCKP